MRGQVEPSQPYEEDRLEGTLPEALGFLLALTHVAATDNRVHGEIPGALNSRRKKEPKPKLFGPDIFQWGRGLPRERLGAKKFDTSLETSEIKLFGRDIPGFCRDIPGAPEKFEKKKFGFNFRSLLMEQLDT